MKRIATARKGGDILSREYDVAMKLAASLDQNFLGSFDKAIQKVDKLELSFKELKNIQMPTTAITNLQNEVTQLNTKLQSVNANRIGENIFKPMKDDIRDVKTHLNQLSSYRLSGDITLAMDTSLDGLEKKLRLLGKFRIGKKVFEPMILSSEKVQNEIRKIQSMRITGDIVKNIREDLGKLENEFKEIKRITGPRDVFQNMISELKTALPDLREMKRLLTDISRIRMPSNQFNNDINNYVNQIKQLEQRMRAIQNMHGPDSGGGGGGGGDSEGGGGAFIAAGGAGLMAGAAVAGGGFFALKYADDYQKAMLQIQASTGQTEAQMKGMKDIAKNLYNQKLGEDWNDLALVVGQAKQVTKQTGAALQVTAKGAIVLRDTFDGLDSKESIKAADTMMRNFGITAKQSFNLLAQGAQKGLDKSGELLDSANEYAPYFAKLGFSAEGMFDVFAGGLEAGAFNLDKVGDGIKEFGIRTKDGSKSSLEAYKSIKLNGAQMTKEFATGGKTAQKAFLKTAKAIAAIKDPALANAASVQLFGTQAEDLEARVIKSYANIKHQFDQTKNTIDEIAKIKYSSMGDALKGIGRQILTSLIIPVSELLLPAFNKFSDWFGTAGPKIGKFFGSVGHQISEAAKNIQWLFTNGFDGEMQGVVMNYGKMFGMDDGQAEVLADNVKEIYTRGKESIGKVQGLFSNMFSGKTFDGAKNAFSTFKNSLLPIKDDILNIVKETFNFDFIDYGSLFASANEIGSSLMPVIQSISEGIGPAFHAVTALLLPLMKLGKQAFGAIIPLVMQLASSLTSKLAPVFTSVFGYITKTLLPQVSTVLQEWLPKVGTIFSKLGGLIMAIYNNGIAPIITSMVAAFQYAFPFISNAVTTAINIIKPIISGLLTILGGVIDFLTGVFTGNWQLAWDGIKGIFTGVWEGLKGVAVAALNGIIGAVNTMIDKVNAVSFTVPDWVPGSGGQTFGGLGIPHLETFAKGGFANNASIFGEAGLEAAIPINNNQRSHDLLAQTNRMMGYTPESSGDNLTLNFNIVIQGNADKDTVSQTIESARPSFKQQYLSMKKQSARVSLS